MTQETKQPTTPAPELLTVKETGAIVKMSRITIWRRVRDNDFPQPISIGPRKFWIAEEVRAYIADRMAERSRVAA